MFNFWKIMDIYLEGRTKSLHTCGRVNCLSFLIIKKKPVFWDQESTSESFKLFVFHCEFPLSTRGFLQIADERIGTLFSHLIWCPIPKKQYMPVQAGIRAGPISYAARNHSNSNSSVNDSWYLSCNCRVVC